MAAVPKNKPEFTYKGTPGKDYELISAHFQLMFICLKLNTKTTADIATEFKNEKLTYKIAQLIQARSP